jgi:S-adenosylmethionine:tRNA ribosyltransferase-isomerase
VTATAARISKHEQHEHAGTGAAGLFRRDIPKSTAATEHAVRPVSLPDALDFALPPDLAAHEPPEARGLARDEVRLLVTYRASNRVAQARFAELPEYLDPGDVLVANDSATLPAALTARREESPTGETFALHLSTRLPGGLWVVEPRAICVAPGERLILPDGGVVTLLAPHRGSQRLWVARLDLPLPVFDYLYRWGKPIAYDYVRGEWPLALYQTVYAREPGSAEMPSAGRAFSQEVLDGLRRKGIGFVTITLHTGVASLETHEPPYEEPYHVPAPTAEAVNAAKAAGRRVIAVGTTAVRALESAAIGRGLVAAAQGWTDLVVTPERGVRVVDGLLTGFHEPKATHLAMLEAIAGRPHLRRAYDAALAGRYLWHEFGDLHLLLP